MKNGQAVNRMPGLTLSLPLFAMVLHWRSGWRLIREREVSVMSKWEELIVLLIEPNTVEELRNMLQEDCWSPGVKQIFREEIERRLSAA